MNEPQSSPPRICFVGQAFWVTRLCSLIERHATDLIKPVCAPVPDDGPGKIRRAIAQCSMVVRVGLRPGAKTVRGFAFDFFFKHFSQVKYKGPLVYIWIGTDVQNAQRDFLLGHHTRFFDDAQDAVHIAGAPWLKEELSAVGVQSDVLLFPEPLPSDSEILPLPESFSLLTYVTDARHELYGGKQIYDAACALPSVRFDVVGGNGSWVKQQLPNLRFHGWVSEMPQFYARATVVLRLVQHDGLGATVKEALVYGRHVIYSYPVPFTQKAEFDNTVQLKSLIETFQRLHETGKLLPNTDGREYALREWDERKLVRGLAEYLLIHSRSRK